MKNYRTLLIAALCLSAWASQAKSEVSTVTLAHQNGWGYLPFYVMKENKLVEKHAKALGIDLTAKFLNLGSPGIIRDSLIAGQVQFGAVGVPTLVQLTDKTLNNKDIGTFKAAGSIVSLPMYLNTRLNVKSICDITGKIALPTVKVSIQAVTLQMAAKKHCGKPFALDDKTVSMTHPDGMQALLTEQIDSHFTAPPFQYIELEEGKGKIKTLTTSTDIIGKRTSFVLMVGSEKFAKENPKAYKALVLALEEAQKWITEDKKRAAELYIRQEKPKESVEDVVKQLSDKDVDFGIVPEGIEAYSMFMHEIGTAKNKLDWKALSLPNLHDKKGS